MLVDILTSHVAKTEEAGKEGDDLMTGKARSANKLIEGLLFLQDIKQQLDVVEVPRGLVPDTCTQRPLCVISRWRTIKIF